MLARSIPAGAIVIVPGIWDSGRTIETVRLDHDYCVFVMERDDREIRVPADKLMTLINGIPVLI